MTGKRRGAALGFVLCLQVLAPACGARGVPATEPVPQAPATVTAPPDPQAPTQPEPAPPVPQPQAPPPECAVGPDAGDPIVTVGLAEQVSAANAPHPTNESERLLFRQVYETLLRVDCRGRAAPGLAASWRLDAERHAWLVTLRDDARFADGSPVTAAEIHASWMRGDREDELRAGVSRLVEAVAAIDDRTLAITLRNRHDEVPIPLAHPDLAVAKFAADSPWPLGTRASRIVPENGSPPGTAGSLTLARDGLPSVRFVIAPRDARDLLDGDADLLITRDPAALDYAATLARFDAVPLAWQRTHVLLMPRGARSFPALGDEARQALATDAVRGEARGAAGPFWWQVPADCEVPPPAVPPSSPSRRIVYDARDAAARDLADRLVALGHFQRANGFADEVLARALRLGTDAGYIVALDSRPLDPCRDLRTLVDRARWLDPHTIVPLVDTRLVALVRRGRAGATVEWDGGMLLAGAEGLVKP